MSADTWLIVAIVGFVVAGVAVITATVLFFVLHIRSVIGDLSGKTVAREIKAMRENNEQSGDKSFRSSRVNLERGKLTEKVDEPKKGGSRARGLPGTDELAATDKLAGTVRLTAATTTLLQNGTTTLLQEEGTTVLAAEGTTVLNENMTPDKPMVRVAFKVKRKMIETHTEELIPETEN